MKQYYKHKLTNLITISKIVTIHYFEFAKNFYTSGESHDFWEIVYAEQGNLLCSADGKQIVLKQGEIIFHKPNEFHSIAADGVTAPNVFIISFVCKSDAINFFAGKKIALKPYLVKFFYSILEEGRQTFDIPFSDPKLTKMEFLKTPILGGEQIIKNFLECFLILLLRNQTEKQHGNTTFLPWKELSQKAVNDVKKLLEENIFSSLTIDKICETISYSKTYLFRVFKEKTGKTIMQYYLELKINQAKIYLRETDLSVREIADKLAFNAPNYFTKTFKRITGLAPLAYKKRSSSLQA